MDGQTLDLGFIHHLAYFEGLFFGTAILGEPLEAIHMGLFGIIIPHLMEASQSLISGYLYIWL